MAQILPEKIAEDFVTPNVNYTDVIYGDLVRHVLTTGTRLKTRNHDCIRRHTITIIFHQTPLVSVRKTAWKTALREWEWFMSGSNNIKDLHPAVHHWWKPWVDEDGNVRYNYSQQFRSFNGVPHAPEEMASAYEPRCVDQIAYLIEGIKVHRTSRRLVATTWNASEMMMPDCPVTNCHGTVVQFFSDEKTNILDMTTYQRSCDLIVGVPHNWFQYWAFLLWMAKRTGSKVGKMTWIGGDVHVYDEPSHRKAADWIVEHAGDTTAKEGYGPPELVHTAESEDLEFKADDFELNRPYYPGFYNEPVKLIV